MASMRHNRFWVAFALLFLAPITACSGKSHASLQAEDVPAAPAAHAVRADIGNFVTLTAEFEPFYEVDVMAKVAGYVRHISVDIGDRVSKGQLLAVLEIPELQDNLAKAQADVKAAQADRAAADGDLKRAQAAASIAHLSYARILDVSKKEPGLVPLQEVDVAHSHDLEAEAQISAAEQHVQAAESRYQAATATLAHEHSLVEYSRIVAPFSGVVTRRYASDGSMIQAGTASQTQAMPVVRVSQDDVLRLMLPVPEEYVGAVHNGATVSVTVPSLGKRFDGTVTRFAGSVQPATRTMTTEVDVKNPRAEIVPGMYAQVNLSLAKAHDAVAVPIAAVDGTGSNATVFVVDGAGVVHLRHVVPGLQSPQQVQILSGIEPGEVVLTGRHSSYHDGQQVRPHLEENAAHAAHS